ncbi:DUF6231 family protein [Marinobacter orientalis]|uniref:Uncharacterized protein n=1 Tax=Marinobacter orientalis TaxID=1928859 RepID=A0A7Y0NLA4_9GAMM|nr:DUF6231 family protein [Marinobacter orientalis]NMT63012.1 hypothetical protein [Marinobacter orientalis]TGX51676.1 hypothetical protein DIT72_06570 [Marinobacter orientalis]
MPTTRQALARIIDTCQPGTLVVCGRVAGEVGNHWCQHHGDSAMTRLDSGSPNDAFPLPQTQDLALITDTLEHLRHEQGEVLLGQLRNYGTHQIAVVVEANSPEWTFTDFIGLGFRRQAELEDETNPSILYTYNIDSYNHKRAWNNPDNWANPEMWGKAWW